jgi:hypothetical protein
MNRHVAPTDVESVLPSLHRIDTSFAHLQDVVSERQKFGVRKLSRTDIECIRENGYCAYFMRFAGNGRRIGSKDFEKLREHGRLDLTVEYILFHNFRDRLDPELRRRIAALLASSVSHPHARWETQPGR